MTDWLTGKLPIVDRLVETLDSLIWRLRKQSKGAQLEVISSCIGIRTIQLSRAIFMLLSQGYDIEATALCRVLIDNVVNGATLMASGEKELRAFLSFEAISMAKHNRKYRDYFGSEGAEFQLELEPYAARMQKYGGKTEKDSSWTSDSVLVRAKRIDNHFSSTQYTELALTVYPDGHSAIHGTFGSLMWLIEDPTSPYESEDERSSIMMPIADAVILCLDSYIKTVTQRFSFSNPTK